MSQMKTGEICVDMRNQKRRTTLNDMYDTFVELSDKEIKRTKDHISKGHKGSELAGLRSYDMELETLQGRRKRVTDLYSQFQEE